MSPEGAADGPGSGGRAERPEGDGEAYAMPPGLPLEPLSPGTNVLLTGPPMTGKSRAAVDALAAGLERDEGAIVLATESRAASVLASLDDALGSGSAADSPRVAVVDCTAASDGEDGEGEDPSGGAFRSDGASVRHVGSPADLTGMGIAFNREGQRLADLGVDRVRVAVESLTPLFVYRDEPTVFRFLQVVTGRIAAGGGVGFVVAHDDASGEEGGSVESLFDAIVTFREREPGSVEARAVGPHARTGEWVPTSGSTPEPVGTRTTAGRPGAGGEKSPVDGAPLAGEIDSLYAAIERVKASGPALTLCNVEVGDRSTLEAYFRRLNVSVREASLSTPDPRNVALLHREDQLLAAADVPALLEAIAVEAPESGVVEAGETSPRERDDPTTTAAARELLAAAGRDTATAQGVWRRMLVRTSRLIETLAWRTGQGTIHAGFQELSRIEDDRGTRRVYERLADRGVDVHCYGAPDVDLEGPFTVHAAAAEELRDTWFVVFTDAPEPAEAGALVARQRSSGEYDGFWSYRPSVAAGIRDYLERTYVAPGADRA